MEDSLQPGQIVRSRAGRDKNRYFIVVMIRDQNYVYISDGDLRKIEKPKLKKIKHLAKTKYFAKEIADNLDIDTTVSNASIRNALKQIIEK